MAERLLQYYKYIVETRGLSGKIALAQLTKMPSVKAAIEPDSPDNINAFRAAITSLTGQEAPNL
jgi:hypothetical protein